MECFISRKINILQYQKGTNRRGATEGQDTRARALNSMALARARIMFWNTKIARVRSVPPIPCIGIGITPIPVSASICCIDTSIIISQYRHLHGWYLYLYCSNGIVVSVFYHYEYWYQYDTFTSYIISYHIFICPISIPIPVPVSVLVFVWMTEQYWYENRYRYGSLSNIGIRISIGISISIGMKVLRARTP